MSTGEGTALLEEFFAQCPKLFFILDRQGAILKLSDSLALLLGPDARAGTPLLSFIHPDDQRAFELAFADLAAPARVSGRVRAQDGAYRAISCEARRAPESLAIHGSLLEEALSHDPAASTAVMEANILRSIHENIPVVIWATDRDGTFFYHVGKGLERAGMKPGQLVGQNIFELYAGYEELLRHTLEGRIEHAFTEAHDVPFENWQIPARDENGEITGIIAISFDITETRRAEKELRDKLALIERQQQVIRALGTPIIEVWDRVLTLPLLGVVDSVRAAGVMDNLLSMVSQKRSRFAILDLTGVEAVDTGTASHLLKLIQALRLLGAEGIITGIQPGVAQTMILLGMNLQGIVTLGSLRDGLRFCIAQMAADKPT